MALALLGWAGASCQATSPWSANITATSDYISRGVSLSAARPVVQGGLDFQSPQGWFAGAWGSHVEPYPYTLYAVEAELYAGVGWQLAPRWSARTSYTRYLYLQDQRPKPYAYGELAASLGFEDRFAATISYQPDGIRFASPGYVGGRSALSYEVSARWPLTRELSCVGSAGYYDLHHFYGVGYTAGSAGLRFTHRRIELELLHFISDHEVARLFEGASANGRWVGSISLRF